MKRLSRLLVLITLSVVMLSCGLLNLSRNADGTYRIETTLSLQIIQATIENASDFSNIVDMNLELRDGYVYVSAAQIEYQGITARDASFHIELGTNNGQISTAITNVQVSNNTFTDEDIQPYNQLLTEQLNQAAQQSEQARLESISVSPDGIKMVWLIDPSINN